MEDVTDSFMISLPLFIFILLNLGNKINYAMWLYYVAFLIMWLFLKPSRNSDRMSNGNCSIKILWLCLIACLYCWQICCRVPRCLTWKYWSDYESASNNKWQRSALAIHDSVEFYIFYSLWIRLILILLRLI